MPGSSVGPVPIIRLFGVTENGNGVQCNVHGFSPYFYIPAPPGFKESDCELFRHTLAVRFASSQCELTFFLQKRLENSITNQGRVKDYVLSVELNQKQNILGYSAGKLRDFLRITVASPKHVPTCRAILEGSFALPNYGDRQYQTFESNIPFVLRFMIDRGILGASWIQIPVGKYRMTTKDRASSTCQIEIDVAYPY